ncbi:MAG TPA: ABC transporter ATP-binding protein [Thermoleophilaceae bacterium]|nr:ABC transporter ATP-binding protein [Thermoleophilaceae bacterium]
MTEPLISVEGLDVVYDTSEGRVAALRDVSLTISPNEILGIVGESGCGKSTLAASLLRLLPASGQIIDGAIRFAGRDLLTLADEQMRRIRGGEIAMIFQDPLSSLNPSFTIGHQMLKAAAAHPEKVAGTERAKRLRAIELLTQVGIPDASQRIDNYPHEFSGGMRQRIMIAMALMLQPALLIADEATTALDVTLEAQIIELFRRLQEEHGTAILFVSHDLGVISEVCDRVIVMYAGRVVEEASVHSLFESPQHPYTRALLGARASYRKRGTPLATIPGRMPNLIAPPAACTYADRCIHTQPLCNQREPSLYGDAGHLARCFLLDPSSGVEPRSSATAGAADIRTSERPDSPSADPLLTLRNVSTYFGGKSGIVARALGRRLQAVRAVEGINLELHRAEVLGLVGESGSGKTTLGLTALRLTPATAGEIVFDGLNLLEMGASELRQIRRRMQMTFQDPHSSLSPRMRVDRLLTEPYRINGTPESERSSVRELLELVRLSEEHSRSFPHELSGGQARRVGIARALALRPDVVIADEPTSGLDASAAASVLNLMGELRRELGLTYLIITHDLNIVGHIADRIAVMYLGQLVEVGPAEAILETPTHPYTQGLLAVVPEANPRARRSKRGLLLPGEIPSPRNPPPGCRFHTRCRLAQEICRVEAPPYAEPAPGHAVACHFWQEAQATRSDVLAAGRAAGETASTRTVGRG